MELHRGGYSPLPIFAGGKKPGFYGGLSADGTKGPWFGLSDWQDFCTTRVSEAKAASWGRMSDRYGGGIGLACGYGGLVAIDIDDDVLIEPLTAVLPSVVVAKRGRKGLTAFYRGDHPRDDEQWWQKRNYKTAEKRGLLDFLAVGAQTVLPPTIHPDISQPYEWTTERTLIDTPLADLPVFTAAHRAKMEDLLRAHGWDAPAPRQQSESVDRPARSQRPGASDSDFDRAIRVARPRWLRHPALGLQRLHRVSGGWRAVASFRASGGGRALGKRGHSLSIRDSGEIVDHGGRGYNDVTLVAECLNISNAEAFAWLRVQIGWIDTPDPVSAVRATYHDNRVSLEDAAARLQTITGTEFEAAILKGIAVRNQTVLKPLLIQPTHPVTVVRSEAGVGKTHAARTGIGKQARLGRRIGYVVPRHDLAEQIAADLALDNIKAEVYRGYERPDPFVSDHAMCRNLPAYKAARELGVGIRESICERRIDNETVRCPLANMCGMERQRESRPQVWIIPAPLLFSKRPDFIFGPDAIVFDESFIDGAIGDTVQIDVAALLESKIEGCSDIDSDAVLPFRMRLADAVKINGDGPLSRAALIKSGIDAEDAYWVGWLEQKCVDQHRLRPDMKPGELKSLTHRHAARNKLARDAGALWHEIAIFLEERKIEAIIGDRSQSGRITVTGGKVFVTPLRTVHPSWCDAPMFVLDATAPPAALLRTAFDGFDDAGLLRTVIEQPDVAAKWPEHVRVRQIMGAPVSKGKLGLWKAPKPRNVRDVVRLIRLRAALAAPDRIGIITYKDLLDQIEGQLPENVTARHFGALAGMNDMQNVAGLIVIGRPAPKRSDVEATASVFAGRPVSGGERYFFDQHPGGIRLADGSVIAVSVDCHPEPIAEALRWRITVGELLQAVGRLRPHRRSEPCWLDIICDVPLPVPVHEVARWGDVAPGAEADMAAQGVILTNNRDAVTAFGVSDWGARGVGGFSIESLIRDSTDSSPVRRFTYQKAGPGQKRYSGLCLPGVLPSGATSLRAWLEDRLGPLASLDVEREKENFRSRLT
ncbi:bifunctional DNA primase/polymerase-like protein [Pseudorhodoplanes sinuspersici]|nr:bifunctional DNA primase/polymerase-like protein [Pseudorhodoplanes sinuspersici]